MREVARLVAASYSEGEAARFSGFAPSRGQLEEVVRVGQEALAHVPVVAGGCVMLSALWVALLRGRLESPAVCVAGDLYLDGALVFGTTETDASLSGRFDSDTTDWNGHCWIV